MSQRDGDGGSPLDSARSTMSNFPMKSVTVASLSSQSPATGASESGIGDISRMPDFPTRSISHRRSLSEVLSVPDDISSYSDLGVVGCMDGPSNFKVTDDELFLMYIDLEKFDTYAGTSEEILQLCDPSGTESPPVPTQQTENLASSLNDKLKFRHLHSYSMIGSISAKSEILATGMEIASHEETRKAILAAKLADLALVDPRRAKRIWANLQTAARWKERIMRQMSDLVQELPRRAAQLAILKKNNDVLLAENNELKLRLKTIEQRMYLLNAQNAAMFTEVLRLTLDTGTRRTNA